MYLHRPFTIVALAAIISVAGICTAAAAVLEPRVSFNSAFVPSDFGQAAGATPNPATGGRDCLNGGGVPIPCSCPPAVHDPQFLNNIDIALKNGAFPPGSSARVPINTDQWNNPSTPQSLRATVMLVALQSLSGQFGVGCPSASAPVLVQQQAG